MDRSYIQRNSKRHSGKPVFLCIGICKNFLKCTRLAVCTTGSNVALILKSTCQMIFGLFYFYILWKSVLLKGSWFRELI